MKRGVPRGAWRLSGSTRPLPRSKLILLALACVLPSTCAVQVWPNQGDFNCTTSVEVTAGYYNEGDMRMLGVHVSFFLHDLRGDGGASDPCYIYGYRDQCCDFLHPGCFACGLDACPDDECATCDDPESYQCFSYTEAEVASSSPDLTFSKKCQTTPTLDKYEDRFTKVTYTKYKETSEIFLSSPVVAASNTTDLNVSVAFSTCSALGGCFEQFLLGETGFLAPVVVPLRVLALDSQPPPGLSPDASCTSSAANGSVTVRTTSSDAGGNGGRDLGAILALDWVVVVFVVVFVLLAISLFGGFSMALPQSWLNKLNSVYDSDGATAGVCNNGYLQAMVRGLIFGLIVSPCVGPFAASVLVFIATSGNVVIGAVGLFFFSLGLSTILLIMALSAGLASKFPKPGPWLDMLKKHCTFVILIMACNTLNSLGDKALTCACLTVVFGGWIVFTLASTLLTATPIDELPLDEMMRRSEGNWFERKFPKIQARNPVSYQRGCLATVLILAQALAYYFVWSYLITGKILPPMWPPAELLDDPPSNIQWVYSYEESVSQALALNKPLMVDFYADWCIPCRTMDYTTLADSKVAELSLDFVAYKADCTKSSYAGAKLKNDMWGIRAMPAYAFITAATLRTRNQNGLAQEPEVVLEYTQSTSKFVKVMESVLSGNISDVVDDNDKFDEDSVEDNLLLSILMCYAWGLLASLTPCVYPMIPTTLALFVKEGARASPSSVEAQHGAGPVIMSHTSIEAGAVSQSDHSKADMVEHERIPESTAAVEATSSRLPVIAKALLYAFGISFTYTTLGIVVTVAL